MTCVSLAALYDVVVKYGEFKNSDNVIDLYCGVGSISLYISKYVNSVLGIEIVEDAIDDAKENAKLNNVDVNVFESNTYQNVKGMYDVIVTNPPIRAGKHVVHDIILNGFNYLKY